MAIVSFIKESNAVFMEKDGVRMGIPKNAWVFTHPTQAGMLVISDKPYFDGVSGIVVPRADVVAPTSTDINDLITKLHRDFFLNAAEAIDWANIQDKPSTFPPAAHTHSISDIVGIDAVLSQKPESTLKWSGFRFDQIPFWECLYQTVNVPTTNATPIVQGTIWYIPLFIERPITISEWAMRVVNGGSAGSQFVLGIIRSRTGAYPLLGNVVYNSTPQNCSTNNSDVVVTSLNITLEADLYYIGIQTNSTTNVTFLGVPLSAIKPILYLPAPNSTEFVTRLSVVQPYSSVFNANQDSANWINGAGYTPYRVLFKLNKPTPK